MIWQTAARDTIRVLYHAAYACARTGIPVWDLPRTRFSWVAVDQQNRVHRWP